MEQGFISISRSITDWRWADNPVMMYFWVHILLMANYRDKEWHDKVVNRGSFITSVAKLSGKLNLSTQQVRTCLERLKEGGEITTSSTNSYTIITVCKYDDYQSPATDEQQTNNKPITNEQQSDNKRTTTTEQRNKETKEQEKKVVDTNVSPKKENVDYHVILNLWNSYAKRNVPKIKAITQPRKDKIKLRIAEMGGWEQARETLETCFRKISESDFATGATGSWAATFDWFFENEKNWLKVLEGNYDNRKEKSQLEVLAENVAKADAYYGQRYGYRGASPYGDQTGSGPYGPDEQ